MKTQVSHYYVEIAEKLGWFADRVMRDTRFFLVFAIVMTVTIFATYELSKRACMAKAGVSSASECNWCANELLECENADQELHDKAVNAAIGVPGGDFVAFVSRQSCTTSISSDGNSVPQRCSYPESSNLQTVMFHVHTSTNTRLTNGAGVAVCS